MKGLQEQTDNRTTFLVIKHSSIVQESKQPRDGFEAIEVTNPRTDEKITKYIKRYNGVEALVCKIEWYEREHEGTRYMGWKLHLDAAGVPCVLDLPFSSRAASRFMKLAENIDYGRPVEFRAWHDQKTDSTAFYVGQDGKSVPQLYTMENPGECPAPTKNRLGKWNFDKQNEYLYDRMTQVVIPAVEQAGNEMPSGEVAPARAQATAVGAAPRKDSPFDEDEETPF